MKMTSLLWSHVYIEHSQLVQYFAHSFTSIANYEYQNNECVQQWNLFKCQTSTSYFSAYRPNLFEHLLTHAGQTGPCTYRHFNFPSQMENEKWKMDTHFPFFIYDEKWKIENGDPISFSIFYRKWKIANHSHISLHGCDTCMWDWYARV